MGIRWWKRFDINDELRCSLCLQVVCSYIQCHVIECTKLGVDPTIRCYSFMIEPV